MKILLVEDTAPLSEEIASVLTMEGYHVTTANTGSQGLAKLLDVHPDLVVTDLIMPVMDGFELIQRIRGIPSFAAVPIVVLSAKVTLEDKQRARNLGASSFIQKPCKINELVSTIKDLLKDRAQ
ncbi:MAG: response regulator transcription factor [Cytophagales bacterium]|nr:response regulator transcription factor [Cytophagales bacterium]